jgi:2-haloacid dehalogenase
VIVLPYSTLLFDIDDTILDFQASEKRALEKLFMHLNRPLTSEIADYYRQLNATLWQRYEKGNVTRNQLLNSRFTLLFRHFGEDIDGASIEKQYRSFLAEGHDQIPGATQLLTDLSQHHDLYIVTNGIAKTQERRVQEAGIAKYFRQMFISERIGFQKPKQAFFDFVSQKIDHFSKQNTLVIGDSLTSDILGANTYGLDSVWFNPAHLHNSTPAEPTFEIDSLTTLKTIVN